jgi:hypothetical protein
VTGGEFTATLYRWPARNDVWVFAQLPEQLSQDLHDTPRPRAGFGAVRVRVALGGSRWTTSVFPSSADGPYVLPVKKAVRTAEGVDVGDAVVIALEVVEAGLRSSVAGRPARGAAGPPGRRPGSPASR